MSEKNIEKMKQLIEEKKKGNGQSGLARPDKKMGATQKGNIFQKKQGGFFDK